MKAITFQGEHDFRVDDVLKPGITASTDALVRVTLGAICGSDLHIYHGHTPMSRGAVVGHEFVGVVEDVGPEVHRFKPGDRVVSSFFTSCGHCYFCRRGWFAQCESKATFGHGEYFGGLGGGQAEYCVVPKADHTMEHISPGLSDEQAIFVGDILATGYFGAERAQITPGDTVAVIGAGPVGLMAVMSAQLFGPARVFAVDVVDSRLELAQSLGAIPVNAAEAHPVEALKEATGNHGVDSSIECVGHMDAIRTAIDCVRGGGTVSSVGVPNKTESDFPYLHMWMRDMSYRAGWCNVQAYMRALLDLVESGRLDPAAIISHRMTLDQGVEAYRLFDSREATKVVLTP